MTCSLFPFEYLDLQKSEMSHQSETPNIFNIFKNKQKHSQVIPKWSSYCMIKHFYFS